MNESFALLIMPAYNEADSIERTLSELKLHLPAYVDVLVINDCSQDDTGLIARQCGVSVLDLPCNLGYGGAVQTGFKYAMCNDYAFGILMDGDGQHDPRYISDLLRVVMEAEADVALGSRFLGQLEYQVPMVRRLGMEIMSWMVSLFSGQSVTDPTSGFQAFRREVICFFANDNYPVDFPDADTLMTLKFNGFRIREVPVTMRARLSGESMHTTSRLFYYICKMLLSILIVTLRHGRSPKPSLN